MGLGKMTYEEALGCAERLKKNADDLRLHIADLKREMNSLNEVLASKGADQVTDTYSMIDTDLEKCPDKIEGFDLYIQEAVKRYRADDAQLGQEGR